MRMGSIVLAGCARYDVQSARSKTNPVVLQWQEAKDDTLAWYPEANYRKVSIWRTIRFPGFLHVNSDRTNQPIRIYMWISLRWLPSLDRTFLGFGQDVSANRPVPRSVQGQGRSGVLTGILGKIPPK